MLIKIAWRNIWRNPLRSLVVIAALALGVWAGTFTSAFVQGMMQERISRIILRENSHIQIHRKGFRDEFDGALFIPAADSLREGLLKDPLVKGVTSRVMVMAMLGTPRGTGAVRLSGIEPEDEQSVTGLGSAVREGEFLSAEKKNPVLISRKTAEKYALGLRSRIVLTFPDSSGEITASAFRVNGIFDTGNEMLDNQNVYVRKDDLLALTGTGVHEIAILLKEHDPAESLAVHYQQKLPDLEVLCWKDTSSGMRYIISMMDVYTLIIVGIILLALLFSIINTMLMAVLERVREIGMLMAFGMNRTRIFFMVMLETLFISLIGGPVGLLLAWASITFFGHAGINLGDAAYEDYGYSNLIYPALATVDYFRVTGMVIVMAFLASLYPARTALRLKPADAIRKT